jgi:hypothetical protein
VTGRDARKLLQAAHENGFDSETERSRAIQGKTLAESWSICWAAVARVHPRGKIRPLIESYIETDFVRARHSRRGT